jgi:hypothetical protein
MRLGVDAGGEKPLECGSGLIDDAERRVACARQKRRLLDELLQQSVERELGAESDPGVHEDAQAIECGLLRHLLPGRCVQGMRPRSLPQPIGGRQPMPALSTGLTIRQ